MCVIGFTLGHMCNACIVIAACVLIHSFMHPHTQFKNTLNHIHSLLSFSLSLSLSPSTMPKINEYESDAERKARKQAKRERRAADLPSAPSSPTPAARKAAASASPATKKKAEVAPVELSPEEEEAAKEKARAKARAYAEERARLHKVVIALGDDEDTIVGTFNSVEDAAAAVTTADGINITAEEKLAMITKVLNNTDMTCFGFRWFKLKEMNDMFLRSQMSAYTAWKSRSRAE